jgi:hypothetical protein
MFLPLQHPPLALVKPGISLFRSRPHILTTPLALLLCAASISSASLRAERVDAELLLLVDASKSAMDRGEFRSLINGYATAMTSSQVIDSIQMGGVGRIAVSLSFFGDGPTRMQGVSWMSIGSLSDAQAFADRLRSLAEPSRSNVRFQDAIGPASRLFGTETGGPSNGFESSVQLIEIAAASRPEGSAGQNRAASNAALASGVDWIGVTLLDENSGKTEAFYVNNVIGGEVGGETPGVNQAGFGSGLQSALAKSISNSVGASAAMTAVPEPSSALLLISSMALLLGIRRRA